MVRRLILLLAIVFCFVEMKANHLVGGELTYQCRGNNNFYFNVSVYRDGFGLTAGNDDPTAIIFVYDLDVPNADPTPYTLNQTTPSGTGVAANDLGPCATNTTPVSVNVKDYDNGSSLINLPVNANGYRVIYQRCCRNNGILNLANAVDGFAQGSTYEVFITRNALIDCGGAATLPMLSISEVPPIQLCTEVELFIDQSVDPSILTQVDSVVYTLCVPFDGALGSTCPNPGVGCALPFNYGAVNYEFGFSANQPLGANSVVEINSQTGILRIFPRTLGKFVVNYCVTSFKNGRIYSNISRDFQFNVFDCQLDAADIPAVENGQDLGVNSVDIDSLEIGSVYLVCNEFDVEFVQSSPQALNYYWDFGVVGVDSDTSLLPTPTYTYPDTGTYLVTFIVNRNEPCVDTVYSIVKIFPTFRAGFVADEGCFTLPVTFTDSSYSSLTNNPIVDWSWDFGDGNTSNGNQNVSHTYDAAGSYLTELIVESSLGCLDTFYMSVNPEPSPVANFDTSLSCTGYNHQFINLSSLNGTALENYSWDFGDGNGFSLTTTDLNPPTQTYNTAGIYNVQLSASSLNGCSDTISKQFEVVERVNADFDNAPVPVCPGQQIEFTNATTQLFDSILWNIDGTNFIEEDPVYTYTSPGSKPISLIVFSAGICGDTINRSILIEDGPYADFVVDSTCTGSVYTFENSSLDNGFPIDDYLWDFGDGNTQNAFEPGHIYDNPGDYTVELIVQSNLVACSDTIVKEISVKEGINPSFTFEPDTICEGVTLVNFTNTTTGGPWDNVVWDFGNDSTSTLDSPNHLYLEDGIYNVSMSVFDNVCGENVAINAIEILDIPQVGLIDSINICDGVLKTLTIENPNSYEVFWSTGEVNTSSIEIDNSIDTIIVLMNNRGCSNSDMLIIGRDCPAFIPNTFTPNGDGINDFFGPLPYNITSFNMHIFNRWGEKVFSTSEFANPWDGIQSIGGEAPVDTYVYVFEGVGLNEKPLFETGTVTIIR